MNGLDKLWLFVGAIAFVLLLQQPVVIWASDNSDLVMLDRAEQLYQQEQYPEER